MSGLRPSDSQIRSIWDKLAAQYPGKWVALDCGDEVKVIGVGEDYSSAVRAAQDAGYDPHIVVCTIPPRPPQRAESATGRESAERGKTGA